MTTSHLHERSASDEGRVIKRRWRKARASNGSCACVEVAPFGGSILIRDSKNDPAADVIFEVGRDGFQSWAHAVAGGHLPVEIDGLQTVASGDGGMVVTETATGRRLIYTALEVEAFAAGVRDGEFAPATL